MARQRFSLNACGSSRGGYVARAHKLYMAQRHEQTKLVIKQIMAPRYFVRCWGKLFQITEIEAARLKPTGAVVVK